MALTDENGSNGMVMPVQPMGYGYGGNVGYAMPMMGGYGGGFGGFGGDWGSLIVLFLIAAMFGGFGGGFGGFGGGFGGGLGVDFPWLLNGQNGINSYANDGFRDAQLHDSVTSVRDGISGLATQLCGCCGDVQMSLANGFAGTTAAITGAQNALAQQMYANTIADLERSFASQTATTQGFNNVQSQLAQCCCDNKSAALENRYVLAQEACATRTADAQNTRDIIDAQNRGTQAILDKLCALELDGVKGQLAQAQRENVGLQNQLNMAALRESQTAQNAFISQGFANEVDALYNRLNSCPVPTTPVYGRTPIFTCNNGGCGCNGGFAG